MTVRVFVMSREPSLGFNALDLAAVPHIGETINVVDVDSVTATDWGGIYSRWFTVTAVVHNVQRGFDPTITIHIEKKS